MKHEDVELGRVYVTSMNEGGIPTVHRNRFGPSQTSRVKVVVLAAEPDGRFLVHTRTHPLRTFYVMASGLDLPGAKEGPR